MRSFELKYSGVSTSLRSNGLKLSEVYSDIVGSRAHSHHPDQVPSASAFSGLLPNIDVNVLCKSGKSGFSLVSVELSQVKSGKMEFSRPSSLENISHTNFNAESQKSERKET